MTDQDYRYRVEIDPPGEPPCAYLCVGPREVENQAPIFRGLMNDLDRELDSESGWRLTVLRNDGASVTVESGAAVRDGLPTPFLTT